MKPLFFYGTLMDVEVLASVIGRKVAERELEVVRVDGWKRVYRKGAWYPLLLPEPGGTLDGRLFGGVDARTLARLRSFEGSEYQLGSLTLRDGRSAQVFLPRPGVPASAEPWDLEDWRERFKAAYLG